ncbi:hypothetical protein V3C99_016497 [Haemonchus contortus]|uniref:Uncharacterized protein n=1 Tax=Haemonchus contortus TaxID=6289 RepID=A0A912N326_HAECO
MTTAHPSDLSAFLCTGTL